MTKQLKRMDHALLRKLSELMIELRSNTNRQPGYISGETLRNVNNRNEYLVINTWEAWNNWFSNEKRAEMEEKVDALIGSTHCILGLTSIDIVLWRGELYCFS